MAKASKSQPKATATRAKKLAGMKVAFIGKFGYLGMWLNELHSMVTHEGGSIVDAAQADPDYLIAGEGTTHPVFAPARLAWSALEQKDLSADSRDVENVNLVVTLTEQRS